MLRLIVFFLNVIPEIMHRLLCRLVGDFIYFFLVNKRYILLSNLYSVFPDKEEQWRRKLARLNCHRWAEMGWVALLSIGWSKKKIRRHIEIADSLTGLLEDLKLSPRPMVILVPHLNLMEAITWVPVFFKSIPQTGVVYRPLGNKLLDSWIQKTRERFGLQLISRKRGIGPLQKILAEKGVVSVLFDQGAGETGILTTFFGKLASSTDLPGRLVEKFKADVGAIYLQRTGFARGILHFEPIITKKEALDVTLESNRWLEKKLLKDSTFYENWLWLHRRWKIQHWPLRRFSIFQKRNRLAETASFRDWDQLPQKTRVWIRMPNWLGDCVMALPLLKVLRLARPDFEVHLVAKASFLEWLAIRADADFFHPLPEKSGLLYFKQFFSWRRNYPETWITLTHSLRSDLEAFFTRAPQRFGIKKQWPRYLLTHTWSPSKEKARTMHQSQLWHLFFQHFGLKEPLSNQPLLSPRKEAFSREGAFVFACFCGSANTPEKRWPVVHWQCLLNRLLKLYPKARCHLLGGSQDFDVCQSVSEGLPKARVRNLAGTTTLPMLEESLLKASFVLTNDTGGMHLANALGIPVGVLYGPTSSVRTGPFFEAPQCLLHAPGSSMESLSPDYVYSELIPWLSKLEQTP